MEPTTTKQSFTGLFDVLDVIEAIIKSAEPVRRKALADTIDRYSDDFPEDFFWATGPQAPAMLVDLLMAIDMACRSNEGTRVRAFRLADRKTEGCA